MNRFHTATLSHDQIRWGLYEAVEKAYPCQQVDGRMYWALILDVYSDFCLVKIPLEGKYQLVKIDYSIDADDVVTLTGDPLPAEKAVLEKGTDKIIVRQMAELVAAGTDAKKYLDDLIEKNPLFAALKGTPNTHLVVFELTSIGRPSQHAGKVKYQLAKSGLAAALPTLISKPIHVTEKYDGHIEAGKAPKPIGVFLGGEGIENADGTITLRVVGSLWAGDFPDEVEEIGKKKKDLGASYEILYNPLAATRLGKDVIELGEYQFAGGAILTKKAAAHPETSVLVAEEHELAPPEDPLEGALTTKQRNALPDSDFAYVKKNDGGAKDRRFPTQDETHRKNAWSRAMQNNPDLSDAEMAAIRDKIMARAKKAGDDWSKDYVKLGANWVKRKKAAAVRQLALVASNDPTTGGVIMKFVGIPEEHQASVESLIAAAVKQAQSEGNLADLTKKIEAADKEVLAFKGLAEKDKASLLESATKIADLTKERDAAKAEIATLTAERNTLKAEKEQLEADRKAETEYDKLAAKHGFDPKDAKLRAQKMPVLKKQVAGQALTMDEIEILTAGGKQSAGKVPTVPLMAGGDAANGLSPETVKKLFPRAAAVMLAPETK